MVIKMMMMDWKNYICVILITQESTSLHLSSRRPGISVSKLHSY
jgi:hypothetical protein